MQRRRRPGRRVLGVILALIPLSWLAIVIAIVLYGHRDDARPADAIVVLGAAQYDGHPSPVLRARLDHAIALYEDGQAARLILTGGRGVGDTTSEAAVGRRYAMAHGVPDSAIVLEARGTTTSQSLHAVAAYLQQRPGRRVLLVSDPFHMLRLAIVASRLGLVPYPSPTQTSPISASPARRWSYVLAESVKVPVAFLTERALD